MDKINEIQRYDNVFLFTNGAIGDFLMAGLFLEETRKTFKEGCFYVVTPRNASLLRELFSSYPRIKIVDLTDQFFLTIFYQVIKSLFKKNLVIRQGVFSRGPLGINLIASLLTIHPKSNYLRFVSKYRVGNRERGKIFFDYNISFYENLVRLIELGGVKVSSAIPKFRFVVQKNLLKHFGMDKGPYVVVHVCASSPKRSLPAERWSDILDYIANSFPDVKVFLTGSEEDNIFIRQVLSLSSHSTAFVNIAGKLSALELVNLISMARGYVGVDTGITHLAGVIQQRSVVIGNLSNPCWLPFYNKNAIILTEKKYCTCDGKKGGHCFYEINGENYYRCMIDVPNEAIFLEIKKMINGTKVL